MRPVLVRSIVSLATFVALWLVAPSAFAAPSSSSSSSSSSSRAMSVAAGFSMHVAMSSAETPDDDDVATSESDTHPVGPRTGAPLCDPRGATTFAPPPQLQDVERTLDVTAGCSSNDGWGAGRDGHQVERERAPSRALDWLSQEPSIAGASLAIGRGEGVRVPAPDVERDARRPGHRAPLDRPPRA